MIALLLILTLAAQGIPVPAAQTGTVTGTLKTDLGAPAVGVRVGAMVRPESPADISAASALSSIAETDAAGHYRLENVPQGRYYITAGRVDYPTFFPGTQDINAGRIVLVKPGDVITGIDFVMNSNSVRPPDFFSGLSITSGINIAMSVKVEGGDPAPVFSTVGIATLRLTRMSDGQVTEVPISASNIFMALPSGGIASEYRIGIENLSSGYTVGAIKYGATELTNNILKLYSSGGSVTILGGTILTSIANLGLNSPPVGGLTVTLVKSIPLAATAGVRVSGRAPTSEVRSVYLSGVPGIFFADGSFEFRGVQPGLYTISTPDNPSSSKPLAAAVVVGNQDVTGIGLTDTPMLPLNIKTPVPAEPVGAHTPGSTVPLAVVRGLVLDDATKEPIKEGTVYLTGHYGASRPLVPDGKFEFSKLLPGSYRMEVQAFGHDTIQMMLILGEHDVDLELRTMPD